MVPGLSMSVKVQGRGRARATRARAVAILGGTIVAALVWITALPEHFEIPNWFYRLSWRGLDPSPLVVPLVLLAVGVGYAARRAGAARAHRRALALLFATSLCAQAASLLLVGPHLETALDRFQGGHGAFLDAAVRERGRPLAEIVRAYPQEAESGRLGVFARSKPPGTFVIYAGIVRLSELTAVRTLVAPIADLAAARPTLRRHADAVATAVVFFPIVTALAVLPIVLLGLALTGRRDAGYDAALLWTSSPAVLVITHHTDGSWYVLLVACGAALGAYGARRDRPALSLAGGVALALAIWSSYGLLPGVGITGAAQLAASIASTPSGPTRPWLARASRHGAWLAAGVLVGLALLLVSGYFPDPIVSYRTAMAHHAEWKAFLIGGVWGLVGALEFWTWAGLPTLLLLALAMVSTLRHLDSRAARALAALALGVVAVHLLVMLYAGSNESARLWLFQLPAIACVIAIDLRRASPFASPRALLALAIAVNVVLVPITRASQPW